MKFINSLLLLTLISCSNTALVTKEIERPEKIKIPKKTSIAVITTSNTGSKPFLSTHQEKERAFAAQSFNDLVIQKLLTGEYKVIHQQNTKQVISDKLAERFTKRKSPDYLFYLNYDESSGILPYSHDRTGNHSKIFFAKAQLNYQIVKQDSGEVIGTGTLNQRFQEAMNDYLYVNGEQIVGLNIDKVALKLRHYLSDEFTGLLKKSKEKYAFRFKKGSKNKFSAIIEKVKDDDYDLAIKAQEIFLENGLSSSDSSDAHFNLALLYLLKRDKKMAKIHAAKVSNLPSTQGLSILMNIFEDHSTGSGI